VHQQRRAFGEIASDDHDLQVPQPALLYVIRRDRIDRRSRRIRLVRADDIKAYDRDFVAAWRGSHRGYRMSLFAERDSAKLASRLMIRLQLAGFGIEGEKYPAGGTDKRGRRIVRECDVIGLREFNSFGR